MDHAIVEVPDETYGVLSRVDPLRLTSRLAVWGTVASVVAVFTGSMFGTLSWFVGGAGAILGGIGSVGLSALILRRRNTRLTWKLAGILGIPFGLGLGALGFVWLFVLPSALVTKGFLDPGLWLPVLGTVVIVGIVLSLLAGTDVLRFIVGRAARQDPEDPAPR